MKTKESANFKKYISLSGKRHRCISEHRSAGKSGSLSYISPQGFSSGHGILYPGRTGSVCIEGLQGPWRQRTALGCSVLSLTSYYTALPYTRCPSQVFSLLFPSFPSPTLSPCSHASSVSPKVLHFWHSPCYCQSSMPFPLS